MATLTLRDCELVIEIEKVQTIRRTVNTRPAVCLECGSKSEFVDLVKIAALFEMAPSRFLNAMHANACHIKAEGGVQICVTSVLSFLRSLSSAKFPSFSDLRVDR
jgi:hypothetical protein